MRSGSNTDIYAQIVNSSGEVKWTVTTGGGGGGDNGDDDNGNGDVPGYQEFFLICIISIITIILIKLIKKKII